MSQSANSSLLSPREFKKALRIDGDKQALGLHAVYDLLEAGRIKHVKVGKRYLILASEVEDFIARESGQPEQRAA